ncbi:loganic acid O-methyltransferase-like [Pistacia vera]|uniref:loganic acid O-methyltransferase-like n=1 Tax=Pistacia vera TaxID=55513 RepID=UPI001262B014|nr:loganic acid O-methyltransferase-like [Pistacia vera]
MSAAESYAMVGGDGAHSYSKNSTYQRLVVDAAKEMINEAIDNNLDIKNLGIFDSSKPFKMADLGCSTGPNTFIAVQNVIEAVEKKCLIEHQNPSALEFQVFFNDQYENDFNTLFKTLPPSRKYFAAGVPGPFQSCLFPKSTLHSVHSSYALHWLSKLPEKIVDRNSPAWNKGSIYCTGLLKEVTEAYSAQYNQDMESFLNARAQELVAGGLMVIALSGLPNDIPMSKTTEGIKYSAESLISHTRAVFGGFIKEHFGNDCVEQIFNHFTTKVEENFSSDLKSTDKVSLFMVLKRISN